MASDPAFAGFRAQPWHRALVDELREVSTGLVYDIAGAEGTAPSPLLAELRILEAALRAAEQTLVAKPTRIRDDARSIATMLTRGARVAPASIPPPPIHARRSVRELRQRVDDLAASAHTAIRAIERNRRYRDTPMSTGASLYQSSDLPRLRELQRVQRAARALAVRIVQLPASAVITLPRMSSGDAAQALRPLAALYERWVFLQIVRAFHGSLDSDVTSSLLSGGDFDERTEYVRPARGGTTIRVRFEPWILTRELAVTGGHGVYRRAGVAHAWRPDILITVEHGMRAGIPVVSGAWVIDAKLATAARRELWDQVLKYSGMCASIDDARVVRSIGLALPARDAGGIAFYESLPPPPHVPLYVLPLMPGAGGTTAGRQGLGRLVSEVEGRRV
jgi:hypothetical protein